MENVSYAGVGLIPLLIGLVAMVRGMGLAARWAPLVAVGLGVSLALLYTVATGPHDFKSYLDAGLVGLVAGLSAVGLYSGTKNLRAG